MGRMTRTADRYADTWQSNDVVSNKLHPEITGRVVAIYRKSDDLRFTKIRLADGAQVWANDDWVLAVGPYLHRCLDCGQPYRSETVAADFCPACDRSQRPNAPDEPDHVNLRWRTEDRGQGRRR